LGQFVKHANAFAYSGHAAYTSKLAPWKLWNERVFPAYYYAFGLGSIITYIVYLTDKNDFDPGEYILGAIPDLLGFAIGVFALIFVLPSAFLQFIDNSKVKTSSIELPVNVGYPLIAMAMTLFLSFLLELGPDENLLIIFLETSLTIYAFEMIFDLISYITTLARTTVHVSKELNQSQPDENADN
jgi:hypothetical protein